MYFGKRWFVLAVLIGTVVLAQDAPRQPADATFAEFGTATHAEDAIRAPAITRLNQWTDMPTEVLRLVPDHYNPCDVLAVGELVGIRHITSNGFPRPLGTRYLGGHWQFDIVFTRSAYYAPHLRELYFGRKYVTINSLVPGDVQCVQQRVVGYADFSQHDGQLWGNIEAYPER